MPFVHLDQTPDSVLHRVQHPLRWEAAPRQPLPDGQVEVRTTPDGAAQPVLLPQPRRRGNYTGVSFFAPECDQDIFEAAHSQLGVDGDEVRCCVSVPNTPLPPQLQLVNDHPFTLRLYGQEERTLVGQHYTLFVAAGEPMPIATFEQRYSQLLQSFQQCNMAAGGAARLRALTDPNVLPGDPISAVCVQALQQLAQTADPSTAFFATLFELDMRASDTEFEEVLEGCHKRAALVAAALDNYVLGDPFLRDDVWDAQAALAVAVPGYVPQRCQYTPFWEPHALQFKFNQDTASSEASLAGMYQDQIGQVARDFIADQGLRTKVLDVVRAHRKELLDSSAYGVDFRETTLSHLGITFKVVVSLDKAAAPGSTGKGSGGSASTETLDATTVG